MGLAAPQPAAGAQVDPSLCEDALNGAVYGANMWIFLPFACLLVFVTSTLGIFEGTCLQKGKKPVWSKFISLFLVVIGILVTTDFHLDF